jgi:hypothetical protein
MVAVLVPSNVPGDKTPDILMDDEPWEMKAPQGASARTIDNQLRLAGHQCPRLVLDLARTTLDDDDVTATIQARLPARPAVHKVLILRHDGTELLIERAIEHES